MLDGTSQVAACVVLCKRKWFGARALRARGKGFFFNSTTERSRSVCSQCSQRFFSTTTMRVKDLPNFGCIATAANVVPYRS